MYDLYLLAYIKTKIYKIYVKNLILKNRGVICNLKVTLNTLLLHTLIYSL